MNNAEQILVIILSGFLALVLLASIIVLVSVIKLLKQLRHIIEKAESIADKAEAVSSFVGKAAGPMAIVRLLKGIVDSVHKQTNKRRTKDGK